jgi:sulfite reductase (NADPH) flavoprotein alpha-component
MQKVDVKQLPPGSPFAPAERAAVESLLGRLSAEQSLWLSGFLAGQAASGTRTSAPSTTAQGLSVVYASETGNAETCAEEAASAAREKGFRVEVVDMADWSVEQLAKAGAVLVVASTWGEGDPPERATDFAESLMAESAPRLEGVQYSVCALGDTAYPDFCQFGIDLDRRLEELGAQRVAPRVDCDLDFEEPFNGWLSSALSKLEGISESEAAPAPELVTEPAIPYGKKNPFPATLKKAIHLNGRGSAKETYHLEFSIEGSGMDYVPGDVVAILPENCVDVVDDFLRSVGFRGDETIERGGQLEPLDAVLVKGYDITALTPAVMKKYAPLAKNERLDRLLEPENKTALSDWIYGRELRDLFLSFPPQEALEVETFVKLLRKMPPRLYSIASSDLIHPGEVHLTVVAVRYEAHGRSLKGVCSTFLCDRIEAGDKVLMYTHHNKNFFLPEDDAAPIIMVGPGTGIAPFRAFVEERAARRATGRNWLFFGEQHFQTDFLYQTEWQQYLKKGVLTHMDVAFSRDTERKVYVQHRMLEKAEELYRWLEEGAYFYVCGDAARMAVDVHEALIQVYVQGGGWDRDKAEAEVKALQKSKRYQRDVY